MNETPDIPLAAAILDDRSVDIDALLAEVVRRHAAAGLRVRGCLMRRPPRETGCAATMHLVDIDTSQSYLVSQPLGTNSRACRADPQGFARASAIFRRALAEEAPDLVVSNRFGDLEVRGGGFSAELLEVMSREIPLLTTVAARNAQAWRDFTGGASLLEPDADAIAAWITHALHTRRTADAA
jgi:hypothetical protein